jgi:hypothetical protein
MYFNFNTNPNRKGKGCTNEEIADDIKRVGQLLNKNPTAVEFNKHSKTVCVNVVLDKFGTWNEALEKAGFLIKCGITDQELINDLKRIYNKLKKNPTASEFEKESKTLTPKAVIKRFGSWNKFVEAAGLKPNKKPYEVD